MEIKAPKVTSTNIAQAATMFVQMPQHREILGTMLDALVYCFTLGTKICPKRKGGRTYFWYGNSAKAFFSISFDYPDNEKRDIHLNMVFMQNGGKTDNAFMSLTPAQAKDLSIQLWAMAHSGGEEKSLNDTLVNGTNFISEV